MRYPTRNRRPPEHLREAFQYLKEQNRRKPSIRRSPRTNHSPLLDEMHIQAVSRRRSIKKKALVMKKVLGARKKVTMRVKALYTPSTVVFEPNMVTRSQKRHQSSKSVSQSSFLEAPPTTQAASKPKLRRSIVMELFAEHCVNKNIQVKKSKSGPTYYLYHGGLKLWRFMLMNGDVAFFFRRYMDKLDRRRHLSSNSELVFSKNRHIIKDFFGFGCRLSPKVMEILMKGNRLPLFETVVALSLEDVNNAWSIPARVFQVNVLNLPTPLPQNINFNYNPYVSTLKLIVSAKSIEYTLQLLTQLGSLFPNLSYVEVVHFYAESDAERLAISLEDESLRDFSIKIKQDKVGIEEFCETFNKRIFQACPFVEFNVDVIYMKEALVSKELKTSKRRRVNGSHVLFQHGLNKITATLYNFSHSTYRYKIEDKHLL